MVLPKKRKTKGGDKPTPPIILTQEKIPSRCGSCGKRIVADHRGYAPPWHCGDCRPGWLEKVAELEGLVATPDGEHDFEVDVHGE